MTGINTFYIVGRLARDLSDKDFGYLSNGNARANISVCVTRDKKEGDNWVEDPSFFDVTIFGKLAESLRPYLQKGKQVAVEGYMKMDKWEKDGKKYYKHALIAEKIMLMSQSEKKNSTYAPENQNDMNFVANNLKHPEDNTMNSNKDIPF